MRLTIGEWMAHGIDLSVPAGDCRSAPAAAAQNKTVCQKLSDVRCMCQKLS